MSNEDEEASRQRVKGTLKALARAGASLVPGGDAVAILAEHAEQFRRDEARRRLDEFAEHFFGGCPPEKTGELLQRVADDTKTAENFHALVSRAVRDDERAKPRTTLG